jgi:aminoglycoside phosphotransferase family enzyme
MTDPGLEAKVAFLLRPDTYPEPTAGVQAVETHLSWVFLTDRHAWKLKKPYRLDHHDLGTEGARHEHCLMEQRLNRRLTEGVYLGVVELTADKGGRLRLGPGGGPVDWLMKMRRLPAARMLDHLIEEHSLEPGELRPVVQALTNAYRRSPPAALTPAAFRARFAKGIEDCRRELDLPEFGLQAAGAICARQLAFLEREAPLLERRVAEGRIVEGHGDLRPEHICLEATPQVIDCLEFSRELRLMDAAEELAFLALECERLGAPQLRATLFAAHADMTGDNPPEALLDFYQSYHACVRAKLAIWHLRDPALGASARWPAQARGYLLLAQRHIERCA